MMTENELINETLDRINSLIQFYTNAISQIESSELRTTYMQMRDQAEKSHSNLNRLMNNHSYLNTDSSHNYISSQSNGILKHMDTQTKHALKASPKKVSIH